MPIVRRLAFATALALLAWPHPAAPQAATRTTLDSVGDVGTDSSIAIGTDGLGLISYWDRTNTALKVAHCSDVECTAATLTTLDDAGEVGEYTSMTIGGDGLGLISYYDRGNGNLKIAHCTNALCTAANIRTVDAAPEDVGRYSRIITGSDGLGLIGYMVGDGAGIKTAHCHDADCSTTTVTTHPGAGGFSLDWIVGNDGLGLFAHVSNVVRAVHCSNLDCSAATISPLASGIGVAMGRGASGLGFVVYSSLGPGGFITSRAGYCVDVPCSSVAFTANNISAGHPVVLGTDGFPMMAQENLYVLDCLNTNCTQQRRNRIDLAPSFQPSMAIGVDGRPLISYWWGGDSDLRVAHCLSPDCRDTGADIRVGAGMDLFFPIGLGSERELRALVGNMGPDTSLDAVLRLAVPPGLHVRSFVPGPPTCQLDGAEMACNIGALPMYQNFIVNLDTVVLVPGPTTLTGSVNAFGSAYDLNPSDNSYTFELPVSQLCSVDNDVAIQEGDAGTSSAVFTIRRSGDLTSSDSVGQYIVAQTATENVDYIPSSGLLTFAPGQETISVAIPIIGDALVETDETFAIGLSSLHDPGMCAVTYVNTVGTIVDDDAPVLSRLEVGHGSSGWHTIGGGAPPWTDVFRLRQEPYASYEVLVDGASGDMLPFTIERLAADNDLVLSASPPGGTVASVRWENASVATTDNQHLRVRSSGCTSGCGADDVYRLRVYETTASVPRVNNTNGQVSLVILQNTTSSTVAGHVHYWSPAGALVATSSLNLGPRATVVLNTTHVPGLAGATGSVTVGHDGPYAALAGKAVALEPATGFSFDSPLVNRPR